MPYEDCVWEILSYLDCWIDKDAKPRVLVDELGIKQAKHIAYLKGDEVEYLASFLKPVCRRQYLEHFT